MRYALVGVLLGMISVITACGGGGGTVATEPVGAEPGAAQVEDSGTTGGGFLTALPSAEDLGKLPAGVDDMIQNGSNYFTALPHQNVERFNDSGIFYNEYPEDLAYAVYRFDLTELRGDTTPQTVYFEFSCAHFNPDPTNFYVGVSNWETSTWDWAPVLIYNYIDLGDMTEYIQADTGHCYMALAFIGTSLFNLTGFEMKNTVIGLPYTYPVTPEVAWVGDEVQFIPDPIGAEPLEFYWDFGYAFSPSTSTDREPTVMPLYSGTYEYSVTISNAYGEREQHFTVEVNGDTETWDHVLVDVHEFENSDVYAGRAGRCASNSLGNVFFMDNMLLEKGGVETHETRVLAIDRYGRDLQTESTESSQCITPTTNAMCSITDFWADNYKSHYVTGTVPTTGEEGDVPYVCRNYEVIKNSLWETYFNPDTLGGDTYGTTDASYGTHLAGVSTGTTNNNGTVLVSLESYEGTVEDTVGWYAENGCHPRSLTCDPADNIFVAGNLFKTDGDSTYLVKVETDGYIAEQKQLIGTGNPVLTMSADGNHLYMRGNQGPATITALDNDLEQRWVYNYQIGTALEITSFDAGDNGYLYALGVCTDLDQGDPGTDYLLITIGPDGAVDHFKIWSGTSDDDEITSIALAPDGKVYTIGNAWNTGGQWEAAPGVITCTVGETLADDTLELETSTPPVITLDSHYLDYDSARYYFARSYLDTRKLLIELTTP